MVSDSHYRCTHDVHDAPPRPPRHPPPTLITAHPRPPCPQPSTTPSASATSCTTHVDYAPPASSVSPTTHDVHDTPPRLPRHARPMSITPHPRPLCPQPPTTSTTPLRVCHVMHDPRRLRPTRFLCVPNHPRCRPASAASSITHLVNGPPASSTSPTTYDVDDTAPRLPHYSPPTLITAHPHCPLPQWPITSMPPTCVCHINHCPP